MESRRQEPDWSKRLPGEQWLILDSPMAAETYLSILEEGTIHREPFPNVDGLYAKISYPNRITQNRIYVFSEG